MEGEETNTKKSRKRTKRILNAIKDQLEFYFSDANLRHDSFLRKEIDETDDGYIPLGTLLTFNKLKSLCPEEQFLKKAIEISEQLQLSNCKQKVKRKHPLPGVQNTDDRSVYVEQLHNFHDQDWLKEVFSTCGTVEYVSLPRYKHNKQIKGFAFIEFSTAEEAGKACMVLNTALPSTGKKHKKRQSEEKSGDEVESHDEEGSNKNNGHKQQRRRSRRRSTSFSESSESEVTKQKRQNDDSISSIPFGSSKRKRSVSESSEVSPAKVKKKRKSSDEKANPVASLSQIKDRVFSLDTENSKKRSEKKKDATGEDNKNQNSKHKEEKLSSEDHLKSERHKKRKHAADDENSSNESDYTKKAKRDETSRKGYDAVASNITEEEHETMTRKKRKNRQHSKKNTKDTHEILVPPLYVISKTKWLELKREYKKLQRVEIGALKKQMRVLRSEKVRRKELKERIIQTIQEKEKTNSKKPKLSVNKENEHGLREGDIKFSNKPTKEKSNPSTKPVDGSKKTGVAIGEEKLHITSNNENKEIADRKSKQDEEFCLHTGTVAFLKTSSEKLTRQSIKATLSQHADVAYVDYIDGCPTGQIRMKSAEMLLKILEVGKDVRKKWEFQVDRMNVEEENKYLKKAEEDRKKKYEKNTKKKERRKMRGKHKVFESAEKISSD